MRLVQHQNFWFLERKGTRCIFLMNSVNLFDTLQTAMSYFVLQAYAWEIFIIDRTLEILFGGLGPTPWQPSGDILCFCLPCRFLWPASRLPRGHVRLLGHLVLLLLEPVVRPPLLHLRHPCFLVLRPTVERALSNNSLAGIL